MTPRSLTLSSTFLILSKFLFIYASISLAMAPLVLLPLFSSSVNASNLLSMLWTRLIIFYRMPSVCCFKINGTFSIREAKSSTYFRAYWAESRKLLVTVVIFKGVSCLTNSCFKGSKLLIILVFAELEVVQEGSYSWLRKDSNSFLIINIVASILGFINIHNLDLSFLSNPNQHLSTSDSVVFFHFFVFNFFELCQLRLYLSLSFSPTFKNINNGNFLIRYFN